MNEIAIRCDGYTFDFSLDSQLTELIAKRENEETTLVAWCDTQRQMHSPQCLHCEMKGSQVERFMDVIKEDDCASLLIRTH
jgi:hypothetical protein